MKWPEPDKNAYQSELNLPDTEAVVPLPEQVIDAISSLRESNEAASSINDEIQAILEKSKTNCGQRVTLKRIENHLYHTFRQVKMTYAEVSLLSQSNFKHSHSSIHYSQIDLAVLFSKLQMLLESYCLYVNECSLSFKEAAKPTKKIGSYRVLRASKLKQLFKVQLKQVFHLKRQPSKIIELHNAYTFLTVFITLLSTGVRSLQNVSSTDISISDSAGFVFIDDKKSDDLHTRELPLSKLSRCQLHEYFCYLEDLAARTTFTYPEMSCNVIALLNGSGDLFSFFGKGGRIYADSGRFINDNFNKPNGLFKKWNRHYLWSLPVDDQPINEHMASYMGNESHTDHSFNKYSASSCADLRAVAEKIEAHLRTTLHMSVVKNPLRG